jgi:hypothetical protein
MAKWDKTTPLDTDFISLGDDNIREMKAALEDALQCDAVEGVESVFPGAAPTTAPVFRYRGLKGTTGARPTAGQYGFYFDSTRGVLQRDNGSSWEDISGGIGIVAGTVMVFCQASAPTGWTKSTSNNDKALRVVSGSGGGTGGTHALSSPPSIAHTHTTASHQLTAAEMPSHTHTQISVTGGGLGGDYVANYGTSGPSYHNSNATGSAGSDNAHAHGDTGSTTPTAFAPQYVDVIVCSKD